MTQNLKLIIQALYLVVNAILIYQSIDIEGARFFYVMVLCFGEAIISLAYVFFNRKKLSKQDKLKEYLIIMMFILAAIFMMWFI